MRKAEVYRNGVLAGMLTEIDKGSYVFLYDDAYFNDNTKPGISLTMPKKQKEYTAEYLFPFSIICYPRELTGKFRQNS